MEPSINPNVLEPVTSGLREHPGIRYLGVEGEAVLLELTIGPEHMNLANTLHGGVIASLIDIACALAARMAPGQDASPATPGTRGVATLSMSLNFVRAVRAGRVKVVGRRVSGGRRVVFAAADVFDEESCLVANGSGCYAFRS